MRLATLTILGGLMLAGITPAMAGDPVEGQKVARMCQTCHGIDGLARIPLAPNIGGEPKDYLEAQLMAFKTGAREHEMMTVVAASLSAQQISDVAAWYASHTASAELADGVSAEDAPSACVSCHGADGISVALNAPNLAGEATTYIVTQLKAFRLGQRKHEIMSEIAAGLSDEEIRAVSDWYANVHLTIVKEE
ncbi:c-type cytochrome [Thioclava atlantica]|uniref:Cytochrome c family protein n=1 Tax=Thioclava atlantica TaxID=1317124 RepID=A0A085TW10_9RHOB|nr:cytochrome c [Thioclava atlantica]KFE34907.1 cytochrome c family protein [Thioclava atlantica]